MTKINVGPVVVLGAVTLAAGILVWSATQSGSWYDQILVYAHEKQRAFTKEFGTGVSRLSKTEDTAALLSLIGLGFVYGIFHAVGPGHGKAIISAYAMTHESILRRTAALSFASALIQGVTAIVAVSGIVLLVEGSLRRAALSADNILEPASYAAVSIVGLYLSFLGLKRFLRLFAISSKENGHHAHAHGHCCGHNHGPAPEDVQSASTFGRAAMVALSVGIRPCSGAILVLILTYSVGLFSSGIAAVVAMSFGTGITVAAIAMTAQSAKLPFANLTEKIGLPTAPIGAGFSLIGGGVIFAIGCGLFYGTVVTPAHPLF